MSVGSLLFQLGLQGGDGLLQGRHLLLLDRQALAHLTDLLLHVVHLWLERQPLLLQPLLGLHLIVDDLHTAPTWSVFFFVDNIAVCDLYILVTVCEPYTVFVYNCKTDCWVHCLMTVVHAVFCRKLGCLTLVRIQQPYQQCHIKKSQTVAPIPVFPCGKKINKKMVWVSQFGIFNVCTDVDACYCTWGLYKHHEICTESQLWGRKPPLPYWEPLPVSYTGDWA